MPTAPEFWAQRGAKAWALWPASLLYGGVARWRMQRPGSVAPIPVVCVGNFTAGGSGKTPTALALGRLLAAHGRRPGFLTRGYRGRECGPLLVDPLKHDAAAVGDEALLLAATAPTVVAQDRPAGARLLTGIGADVVIMDDGFQNPSIAKDLSILVVDAVHGLGNGFVMPAGPLRAPLSTQLRHTDLLLVIGEGRAAADLVRRAARRGIPISEASVAAEADAGLNGLPVLAFCGIGQPDKFFRSLERCGADLRRTIAFPDHHAYSDSDCRRVLDEAGGHGLVPVTTEKDHVKLRGREGDAARLAAASRVLPVRLLFREPKKVLALVEGAAARRLTGDPRR
ncbi:tetraacyldisaccharide 4'-kinase [Faunimonas sp. B44]|uniref:tetraacyldisaccharide 4'-kinase n=1 Tax=Faunimonas sp. B44 TaxID=3461493 RepID=UPI004043BE38